MDRAYDALLHFVCFLNQTIFFFGSVEKNYLENQMYKSNIQNISVHLTKKNYSDKKQRVQLKTL